MPVENMVRKIHVFPRLMPIYHFLLLLAIVVIFQTLGNGNNFFKFVGSVPAPVRPKMITSFYLITVLVIMKRLNKSNLFSCYEKTELVP